MSKKHERYTEYKKDNNLDGSTEVANAFYMGYGHGFADSSEDKMTTVNSDEKNLTTKERIISIMDKSPNHAYELLMDYQKRIDEKDKRIATKEAQIEKLKEAYENLVRDIPHYEDCDAEDHGDDEGCTCGARFEKKRARQALEELKGEEG